MCDPLECGEGRIDQQHVKEITIIWIAIVLIIVSFLFPPFGYTKVTVQSFPVTDLLISSGFTNETTHEIFPWKYIGHRFIFAEPPRRDPKLDAYYKQVSSSGFKFVHSIDDMQIAWRVVAVEDLIIILLAGGAIFTLSKRCKPEADQVG
jgi:hypothetical protein